MTIDTYILLVDVATASADKMSDNSTAALALSVAQEPTPELSPLAQIVSELQELQQDNPAEYAQIASQISSNLQAAAQTAQTAGSTTSASQLAQLATVFTNASQSGQLPDIQDLIQADGYHYYASSSSTGSDSGSSSSSSSGSNNSPDGGSDQGSNQIAPYAYENNGQDGSASPLAIILDTLVTPGTSL
jgi:hypothetical protein